MGKVYLVQHADGCECVTAIMVFTDKEIAKEVSGNIWKSCS